MGNSDHTSTSSTTEGVESLHSADIDDLALQAELHAKEVGHKSRSGMLSDFLEAVELYTVPAGELLNDDWLQLAQLATAKATEVVEGLLEELEGLRRTLEALRPAAAELRVAGR